MTEPDTGLTVAVKCAKGCGLDVLVPTAQMELLRGIPGAPRFQHEKCAEEGRDDKDSPERQFYVELIVTEELADDAEDVCARFKVGVQTKTFVEAASAISPQLSKMWEKVVENAPLVDIPRDTP